jgi:hypothetical protein
MVMTAQVQQPWVKTSLIAESFHNSRFEVIVQDGSGNPTPVMESVDVAEQEVL